MCLFWIIWCLLLRSLFLLSIPRYIGIYLIMYELRYTQLYNHVSTSRQSKPRTCSISQELEQKDERARAKQVPKPPID